MKTATVCIGNSDNKLTQQEWHKFTTEIRLTVARFTKTVHFEGFSASDSEYQNACWVFEIDQTLVSNLKYCFKMIREHYKQDSLALVLGDTDFV